jgi:NADH-quinone oxidoreductase subunit I
MNSFFKYFSDVFHGVKSLLIGMTVTGRYFFTSPGTIVTQQYPENRKKLVMFERFRGEVIMPHDSNNQHRCNGCGICENSCPNGSIEIITSKISTPDGKQKRIIDKHIYHLGMCTFCGLCVKSCPSEAIVFGNEFEHAVFDRARLTKVLNKPGSSIVKDAA